MSETKNDNLNNIIDLSTASQETGYHQNYLGFLCRQGILNGFKTGRNWLIAREDLDKFVQTHQNGISEVADETGQKIPVHNNSQNLSDRGQQLYGVKDVSPSASDNVENPNVPSTENIISLSEASKVTGYHQDYLAFLCRSEKLQASKIGRNWITTKQALDDFIKNHKNGITEVVDETGTKIPVHITNADLEVKPAAENLTPSNNFVPSFPTENPNDKILFSVTAAQEILIPKTSLPIPAVVDGQPLNNSNLGIPFPATEQPANLELTKLKKSVLNDLEERVSKLDGSLGRLEKEVQAGTFQTKFLNGQQKKTLEQPPIVALPQPMSEPRQPLHEKFASNFPFTELMGEKSVSTPSSSLLDKDNIKKLYGSFVQKSKINFNRFGAYALAAIFVALFMGSVFWGNLFNNMSGGNRPQETKIVYQGNPNKNQTAIIGRGNSLQGNTTINKNITQLLGFSSSDIYNLIDNRLNQYLAEGKFKGEKGDQGLAGPVGGTLGLPGGTNVFTSYQPNPGTGFGGGTALAVGIFSANEANINSATLNQLTVGGAAVFNGSVALNASTTIADLNVASLNPNFTPGSVAFQGAHNLTQDNSNFFYDQTNKRLGLGTSTPSANLTIVANASSTPLAIVSSAGASMMSLLQNGDLTINTSSPLGNLAIKQINNGDTIFYAQRNTDTAPVGDFINYTSAAGASLFRIDSSGNITNSGTILNGGAVTIAATSTPQLTVQYDAQSEWSASTNASGNTTFAFNGTSTPSVAFIPQHNSANTFSFQTASAFPVLSIDTLNRRVGINTSSPSVTLAVVGQNNTDVFDVASSSGASYLRITNEGNVGIGTTTPSVALSVIGSALLSGDETLLGQLSVASTSTLATTSIAQLTVTGTSNFATTTLTVLTANNIVTFNSTLTVNGTSTLATSTIAQLTVSGNELTGGNSTTTGSHYVGGNLAVNGNSAITGNQTVTGNATTTGSHYIGNNLTVNGNSYVTGNSFVMGSQSVTGNATTTGNQIITGNFNVSGISNLATSTISNLTVTNTTTLASNINLTGTNPIIDLTTGSTLFLNTVTNRPITTGSGLVTLGGNVLISGATTTLASTNISLTGGSTNFDLTSGTFNINTINNRPTIFGSGLVTLGGGLDVTTGNVNLSTISGNVVLGNSNGTFANNAATSTIASNAINLTGNNPIIDLATGTLNFNTANNRPVNFGTGSVTLGGNLLVLGNATTSGNSVISGNQLVYGNSTTTGSNYVGGNFTVNGNSAMTGNLSVTGNQIITGNSTTTGNQIITGALNVSGVSTLATTTISNLTVTNTTTLASNLNLTGTNPIIDLTSASTLGINTVTNRPITFGSGLATFGGNVTVSGATTTLASTVLSLTGASPVLDATTGTLNINTLNNRPITFGSGLLTAGGSLLVTGSATTTANQIILGNLSVSGTGNFATSTIAKVTVTGDLSVGGNATTSGSHYIGGNLAVNGNSSVTGNQTVTGNATTTGSHAISGNFNVSGSSNLATSTISNLTVTNTTTLASNLNFTGTNPIIDLITGTLNLNTVNNRPLTFGTGLFTLGGNFSVAGNATTTGSQNVGSNLSVGGNIAVTGNSSVTGNATTTGSHYIGGNLAVNGNSAISGNQTVTGNATTTGSHYIGNNLAVNGNQSVSGNSTTTGVSYLNGAVALGNTLNVSGTSTLATTTLTALTANTFNGQIITPGSGTLTLNNNMLIVQGGGTTLTGSNNITSAILATSTITNVTVNGNSHTLTLQGGDTLLIGANNITSSNISTSTVATSTISGLIASNAALNNSTINSVTIQGNTHTLTLANDIALDQNLRTTDAPAFAGLTINGNATTTGNQIITGNFNITGTSTLASATIASLTVSQAPTITAFNTVGIVHNSASGLLSSSLIVNNDITAGTITSSKLVGTDITTVGALATGTIVSGFGTIATANTITGTTLNATTGINTGSGSGTNRIDVNGNLVNIGTINSGAITSSGALALGSNTITSGLINGQTISSAANFTGTVAAAGAINSTVTGIQTGSVTRIDTSGNLTNIGTITSGLINGQTISSAANFTGTLGVNGTSTLATTTVTNLTISGATIQTGTSTLATTTVTALTVSNGLTVSGGTITLPATSIANAALQGSGALTVTAGTGLSGGGLVALGGSVTLSLPNTGTAGTYGSSSVVPTITTDAQGRITGVSTSTVIAPAGTLTGNTLNSGVTGSSLTSVGILTGLTMGGNLAMGGNNITGGGTITGTTLNGTTGINTGATGGTNRIDVNGNLVNIGTIASTYLTTTANTVNFSGASTVLQLNGTQIMDNSRNMSNIGTISSGAITSSGALALGSNTITSGLINGQTISSAANFTGTVAAAGAINSTVTGIQTGSVTRIDTSGNLTNIGTITSGLINGQTISSIANFTGTLTVVGTSTLATTTVTQLTANTFNGLTLTSNVDGYSVAGGTASRQLSIQGGNTALIGANSISTSTIASSTINNITINGGGYALSLFGNSNINQNLMTTSTPAFAGLTINGNATTTGNTVMQGTLAVTTQTTPQLTIGYDAGNYWTSTIGSTGALAMAGNGTGAGLTIKTQSSSVSDNYASQSKIASMVSAAIVGGTLQLAQIPCGSYFVSGAGSDGLTYGTVTGEDGHCWLDRNLGATATATSYSDYRAYGNLYQWGRGADGHQLVTWTNGTGGYSSISAATTTLSSGDTPGNNNFIEAPGSPYDWRNPQAIVSGGSQNSTIWQGANGANNVCPSGFRLPTQAEWQTLTNSITVGSGTLTTCTGSPTDCRVAAANSKLKLPTAGNRDYSGGSPNNQSNYGFYWSSPVNGTGAYDLNFNSTYVSPANGSNRAYGFSVRCIKDY